MSIFRLGNGRSYGGGSASGLSMATPTSPNERMPMPTKLGERFRTALEVPRSIADQMSLTNKRILAIAVAAWIVGIVAIVLAVSYRAN